MKPLQMDKLLILGAILVVPAFQIDLEDNNYETYEGLTDDEDVEIPDVYGDYNNDRTFIDDRFKDNSLGDNDYVIGSSMRDKFGEDEYRKYDGKNQVSSEVAAPLFPSGPNIYEGSGEDEFGDNRNDDQEELQDDGYRSYYRNGQGSSQVALPHYPNNIISSAEVEEDGYDDKYHNGQGSYQVKEPYFPSAEIEDDEHGYDYGDDQDSKPSLLDIDNKFGSSVTCSQTCLSGAQRKCANTAQNTCKKKCAGGGRKSGGCNNAWGTLPSNTFSDWINQIERMRLARGYELIGISKCDRTTPNELVVFINSIIAKQKERITTPVREDLMKIFGQIDQCCKPNNGWRKPSGVRWVIEEDWSGIVGGGGGQLTGGCNDAWGSLSSDTFSDWINQIEILQITGGYELSGISECDQTTPNELVVFINSIIANQKQKITTTVRENLINIFGQIDQCCKPNNGWTKPTGVRWVIEDISGGGGTQQTGGCNNAWGTLPSDTFSDWINQIEILKMIPRYELTRISKCDRTTPNELVVFINSIIAKQRQKITTSVRDNLMDIFGQIDQCCKPNNGWKKPSGVRWVIEDIVGGGGAQQTRGCNGAWGSLSSDTFSDWINQIEILQITGGYELSGISECDQTTPNELVVFINSIIANQKRKITTTVRENLINIFGQIDQCCKPNNGWTKPSGVRWVIEDISGSGGAQQTGGCNNAWGTLPSNTFSDWINQIEIMKMIPRYELTRISKCDRTTPNELVVFINSIIAKQKQRIPTTVKDNLINIFGQIDQCCKPNNGWTKPSGVRWVIEDIVGSGGAQQTGGCNNAWGTLPSNTFSDWINQIEILKMIPRYELTRISKCDRTTPNEMVVFINSIIAKQKERITTTVRENLMDIFGEINQCCKPNNGWTRPTGVQWVIEEDFSGIGGIDVGLYGTDDCQVKDSGLAVVPTIVYTQWINELRPLDIFSKRDLCECQTYARSNPDELIAFINAHWQKKSSQVNFNMRQTLKSIISNIGLYNSERTGITSVAPINVKIITWKQEITQIRKEAKIKQDILERLTTIINSAGTVANCIPMITEIKRICTQDRIPRKTKTQLEKVMIDMKRAALKEKISYLLTTYDKLIKDDIKLKLSQICHTQDVYDYSQMVQQFDNTVEYIQTLIQRSLLPAQCQSELKIICTKLGVDGFDQGGQVDVVLPRRITKFITISKLIAMLASSPSASFEVGSIQDCLGVCVKSVLESSCPYGYGKCSTQASQIGRKVTCTVKVDQCKKTSSVPQLSTEEVIKILKTKQKAECITFSSDACNKICKQFVRSKDLMFGGIQCKLNWDGNTKICSIQTSGQRALTPWLNDQCGQGCRYDDLSFLDLDQVGGLANGRSGCRFKTPDQQTCKQYCDQGVDIPSSCPGSFTCNSGCKCWPGSCICTIKHVCQQDRNPYFRSAKNKAANGVVEENIEVPKVLPVVSEGKSVIKNDE